MRNAQAKIGETEFRELLTAFLRASRDAAVLRSLLEDLLTPAEINELVARLQIVKHLERGETQRAISEKLHVTLQTVNRGARALTHSRGGFKKVLHI